MFQDMPPGALTLSQLTYEIGMAVQTHPRLRGAWVVAELSDVRVNGGHCYMELIEKNELGQTVAKLRAAIWASRFQVIRRKFFDATGRDVATGMKVMLYGGVSYHSLYGLQFTISDIDPSYTLGDMERLRREILLRLQKEGILDRNKSLELTALPQRIAVISAEGAAGYGDFMNQLMGNTQGFVFYPFLFSAILQGDRTSESVRSALNFIEMTVDLWDCVVIIRGGGATTDLNGFDDFELAKAVALFPLPVVVGIGHERDRTVLDEIAHTRMKTPTAVAAFFLDRARQAHDHVSGLTDWIARYSADRLLGEHRRLDNLETLVPTIAQSKIRDAQALLDREMARIPALVSSRLVQEKVRAESLARMAATLAASRCMREGQRIDNVKGMLAMRTENIMKQAVAKIDALSGLVAVLSPDNTLKRGYSVTRINGKAVTDTENISPGSVMETTLFQGKITSTITNYE